MITVLLGLAIFGFLGLSVLCPLMALPAYHFRRKRHPEIGRQDQGKSHAVSSIEIFIPAHNEAERIGLTLASIQRSIQHLESRGNRPALKIGIRVGADGCTDQTTPVARQFPKVLVTEFPEKRGKWITLKTMVNDSGADWVMLVDAGTLWPETFLADVLERLGARGEEIMAVAPSYRPHKSGWLHRLLWGLETAFKRVESICGGPVSLHGATVGYKTPFLKNALASLGNTLWLNDDVVIPLTLRTLYPEGVILYPVGEVRDAGVKPHELDLGRRKRMLLGNLQWARALLPSCLRRNPVAAVMAGRRLFRVLWAYWIVMFVFGLAMAFHFAVLPGIAGLGVLSVASGSFRQLIGAALISLLAPFLILRMNEEKSGAWQ